MNIIPSTTGAAKAIGLVVPKKSIQLDGFALRVPVMDGSCVDLTVALEKEVEVDAVNALFKKAAAIPSSRAFSSTPTSPWSAATSSTTPTAQSSTARAP